jgi:hypothetical protein
MKPTSLAVLAAAIAFTYFPSSANATALSDLTSATAAATLASNGNNNQTWDWQTLTAGPAFEIQSNSAQATNGQLLFEVELSGSNNNSNIVSYAGQISNEHSGTNSTNYGLIAQADSGTLHNIGLLGQVFGVLNAGDAGVRGYVTADSGSGATYAVHGLTNNSIGYAGYFDNTGGGYAAAFMDGNVGIGTATPSHTLDINGTLNVSGAVTCGSGCGGGPWSVSGSSIIPSSTSYSLGIGTTSPKSLVHAYGGEVQVGSSGASCAAAIGGAIRFSGSTLYYCDGSSTWQTISTPTSLPSLTTADIWVGNASNVATAVALSGDCTLSNAGAITCTKTSGTSFSALATATSVNLSSQATGTLQAGQFPALTGDVTTTAGGLATTVAKIQGTTVSGTTGTGNVVFSASPTLTGTITAAAANFSGNVGIGTTSPTNALSLGGNAAQTIWMERNPTSNTAGNGLTVQASGATTGATNKNGGTLTLASGTSTGTGSSSIQFQTYNAGSSGTSDNSATTQVTITGAGNVGIGTATPGSLLSVNGGAAFGSYGGNATAAPSNGLIVSGSVGIGTPSPSGSAALQIRAAANQTLQVSGPASAASGTSIRSIKDDYSVWEPIEIVGSTTILGEAGNVGVATTSPSYTLQVNGSVAGTSAYVNTSDIRHKKNIQPLEVGLKEVAQLRPVTFEWKGDTLTNHSIDGKAILRPLDPAMQGKQMGFVAQDVEKILPSVIVTEANAEKTKGMKYSELIPVLVKSVQELKANNDKLRSDFDAYRASHR